MKVALYLLGSGLCLAMAFVDSDAASDHPGYHVALNLTVSLFFAFSALEKLDGRS